MNQITRYLIHFTRVFFVVLTEKTGKVNLTGRRTEIPGGGGGVPRTGASGYIKAGWMAGGTLDEATIPLQILLYYSLLMVRCSRPASQPGSTTRAISKDVQGWSETT